MNDNNNDTQSVAPKATSNFSAVPRVVKGGDESLLVKAWNNLTQIRGFLYGGIFIGVVSNLHYSRDADMIESSQHEPPMVFHHQDDGTVYIEQGTNLLSGYKGITCLAPFGFAKDKALAIGSKGDASINPVDENVAATLAGTLGVVRDVTITEKPSENAAELMRDLYAYSEKCRQDIMRLHQAENETLLPPPALENN